jgi:hypothetical protein
LRNLHLFKQVFVFPLQFLQMRIQRHALTPSDVWSFQCITEKGVWHAASAA